MRQGWLIQVADGSVRSVALYPSVEDAQAAA
jgi:hypothetical protein